MRFSWASHVPKDSLKRLAKFYLIANYESTYHFHPQGGKLDLAGAARLVLRDWSTGKLSRYAVPPPVSGGPGTATDVVSPALATIYAGDAALLERLPPRKELRRSRDIVRLSPERVDDRALALDAPWFDADGGSGEDGEDESEAEAIGSGTDDDDAGAEFGGQDGSVSEEEEEDNEGEDEDEDAEDEDEVPLNPRSSIARKRKRPSSPSLKPQLGPTRPRKKVSFATSVKTLANSTRSSSSSKEHTLSRPSAIRPSSTQKSKAKASRTTIPPRARKPAANAPTQKRKTAAEGENDAYDFSTFF